MALSPTVQQFLQLREQLNAKPALMRRPAAGPMQGAYTAGAGPAAPGNVSGIQAIVRRLAEQRGWGGSEGDALHRLIMKESGYRNTVKNPKSSAYGIFQFLDNTWKPYGAKTSDPALQTQYGLDYINRRYGSPSRALAFHQTKGWY